MAQSRRVGAESDGGAACRVGRQGRRIPPGVRWRVRAPRILADLRADGETVSRKTVAASLRRQRLAGISPRTFAPATTVVDLDAPVLKDLVGRRFDTGALNRVDLRYHLLANG